ncbi:hypothetical protein P4H66_06320 [Paenibacillus dokdonensis]|uniref:Uncharacterized protein n=1 Tax=Paenibacillus dokdonensis TaxID=2567944 RepID=A0ABU6GL71_9BACL|nr:hypothetical protein [Paenibacillus dokdonensis]MEC0239470.1 hypothetical protein [Paenibacillus dokdonensis]
MIEKTDIEKMIAPARHSLQHVPLTESMVIGGTIGKLQRALEEKDAVIKKLQTENEYLKGIILSCTGDNERLRKALEEVHTAMEDAVSVMEMEHRDFDLMPQCTIHEAAEKLEKILHPDTPL